MPKSFHQVSLAVVISLFAGASAGCSQFFVQYLGEERTDLNLLEPASSTVPAGVNPVSSPTLTQPQVYQRAIDRASSAFTLSRSAQSQDDWQLVANRWQQAIDIMASVPGSDAQHAQAQKKMLEYRKNLAYAQQQANRSTVDSSTSGIVVVRTPSGHGGSRPAQVPVHAPAVATSAQSPVVPAAASTTMPTATSATAATVSSSANVFHAPIIRREGNTPVIRVTFNNNQTFDMIVDTGASGTLITAQQAQALGVTPVAAAMVDTASQRGVTVPLGYVNSIEVNGAVATNVLVAIAGPQLGTGLLGHDFFGHYDVTIRESEVEFRERG